jgi:hypothetical protein
LADILTSGDEVTALRKTVVAVRATCHERLRDLTITACILEADSAAEIGKVKRIGDDIKAVTKDAPDVVLTVWDFWWKHATAAQQDALVDHLLCHIGYSDLSGKCWINRHDFEGFRGEIARRGPWSDELQEVRTQLRLWGSDRVEIDAGDEASEPAGSHDPETGEVLDEVESLVAGMRQTVEDVIGPSKATIRHGGRTLTLTGPG